ncbi:MAG: tetrahydrofolate dehydrogenase/cyclohydrolase catalytic domain-containing protein [Longimicrobiales bacterium]
MSQILNGSAIAERIRAAAAERIASMRRSSGGPPVLAAVAVDTPDGSPLYFDVKESAFTHAGAHFQAHILPHGTTTDDLIRCVTQLNADAAVHGIYVQYPLPADIDAQRAYDTIAPDKDVDGAAQSSFDIHASRFRPATAEAVLRLLEQHAIELNGCRVCVVRGDPLFARHLDALFRVAGAIPTIVEQDAPNVDAQAGAADVVVVASGVVNGVRGQAFRDDAVAIDVGYYHGGGRGDIDAAPADIERLRAYAPPRGAIGPLTVAILLEHTIDAAQQRGAVEP